MPERDPYDELREAWDALEAPDPDALAERDDAALAWMRSAWRAVEAPPAAIPPRLARPTWRALPRVAALAAAAALLVALGTWWRIGPGPAPAGPGPIAQASVEETAPEPAAEEPPVQLASIEPDRMELRSGPVRLYLVTGTSAEPVESDERTNPEGPEREVMR